MKVELIDRMGDDLTVVNAARVSFNKQSDWGWFEPLGNDPNPPVVHHEGLKPSDQKLIKYLATHNHWTPFSHVIIQMREKVPLFVARQRFKHMVGFTYNERSGRYVGRDVEIFHPSEWRRQAEDKKQGSSDELITEIMTTNGPKKIDEAYAEVVNWLVEYYYHLVASGVAVEQARMVLPQSMYTEYYVTGSLAAWARAYKLRIDSHAQREIQYLAQEWDKIIKGLPELKYSWNALTAS